MSATDTFILKTFDQAFDRNTMEWMIQAKMNEQSRAIIYNQWDEAKDWLWLTLYNIRHIKR